ncbi:MAG: hypothetical protein JWQ11_3048 [Rhizobacter sp.]|nr:hypothetical protein [Rhizobacter sp.]
MTHSLDLPAAPDVLSIRELASRRSGAAQLSAFTAHAREIAAMSHLALLQEFNHQDDPLMLWVVHREADSRNMAPALRWGTYTRVPLVSLPSADPGTGNDSTQRLFVNWLADILWLANRDRAWRPQEPTWTALFEQAPNSADWHAHALRVFNDGAASPDVFATRLGLAKRTRLSTLTLTTEAIEAERASLLQLDDLTRRIAQYAASRPDRSGAYTPAQVVERRLLAHRLFVLAGRQQGLAARYQSLITGQTVSRQAFTRQLDALGTSTLEVAEMGSPDRQHASNAPATGGASPG